jgi:hypothetical protein
MKNIAFLIILFFASCATEKTDNSTVQNEIDTSTIESNFEINLSENEALDFEKIRIYPIIATEAHIAEHAQLANFKNLKEAMDIQGFRITEKKPYGRFDDAGAINSLTVQNKSQDTVYLMAGDVVKGGNQDRVLAQDMVLPPRTLASIKVFCVEQNRWEYRDATDQEETAKQKKDRKVFAFSGYYNVVSNNIRRTVKEEKDQNSVWAAVGDLTTSNKAVSSTGTYTALEDSKEFTVERNRYLAFFEDKMDNVENVIGMVVVSGNEVLGTDIFNHPNLFKKQYKVLLHSYVTDAVTNGGKVKISAKVMESKASTIKINYERKLSKEKEGNSKFKYDGKIIHFSDL